MYNSIEAARAARRYPVILELVEQSAITLTAIRLLAPSLTAGNHAALLAAARHKSKREIEELVCSVKPKPDAPAIVRKLPVSRAVPSVPLLSTPNAPPANPVAAAPPSAVEPRCEIPAAPPNGPGRIAALAPERYRIQLTVSRETYDKFRHAQALLRHAVPSGDAAEIFHRAVSLLVERLERQRCPRRRVRAAQPRRGALAPHPGCVRRAVWRRDGGRCAFLGARGRCGETAFLEFHHVEPDAAGGPATTENIELRCRAHNAYQARLFFTPEVVREKQPSWPDSSFRNESVTAGHGYVVHGIDRWPELAALALRSAVSVADSASCVLRRTFVTEPPLDTTPYSVVATERRSRRVRANSPAEGVEWALPNPHRWRRHRADRCGCAILGLQLGRDWIRFGHPLASGDRAQCEADARGEPPGTHALAGGDGQTDILMPVRGVSCSCAVDVNDGEDDVYHPGIGGRDRSRVPPRSEERLTVAVVSGHCNPARYSATARISSSLSRPASARMTCARSLLRLPLLKSVSCCTT